ncbi:amino acid transporter [Pyrrhoderma noxium]|uniref:Amino acid transporter n=1 Tax=Pyrrhoderma noxium TaxID=2282107 RepID=A0A286UQV7_9AGAM|nr:amino acid transporter [Pyrrhoderma noxium]
MEGHDNSGGEVTPRSVSRPIPGRPVPGRGRRTRNRQNRSRLELATEQSPLLRKEPSRSSIVRQYTQGPVDGLSVADTQAGELDEGGDAQAQKTLQLRRKSSAISKVEKEFVPGRSTFGQTLFNSIAILLGFGMLSEPLAFAYAGWIGGTILIIFYGLITCYTAKILAQIMASDPQIRTYADIGNVAFGPRSRFITSSLFCLELFSVSVVLVTLFGDSLHSVIPTYSSETYKIIGLAIFIPSVFCPLSVLSYTSIIGIISTLLIVAVLFIDGLSKTDSPGSLWSPAPTNFLIAGWGELGIAFGLFMAGFSGHAVLPSLARDMANPKEFNRMINMAFTAATIIYAIIGGCGYLMFGNSVSDEVSEDLLATPGYNVFLNKVAVWSLVIMPLTKFALSTRPVNITLEIILGLDAQSQQSTTRPRFLTDLLVVIERSVFACLSVAVSIFIPDFSSMMAFVGSFSAFILCVIGPVSAKIALSRKCSWADAGLMGIAIIMAAWGTIAAFAA